MAKTVVKSRHKINAILGSKSRRFAIAFVLVLVACGLTISGWRTRHVVTPPPQTSQPQLSKEYIYAGGRLVAIEESGGGTQPTPAPTGLLATATVVGAVSVSIDWVAPSIQPVNYEVERRTSLSDPSPTIFVCAGPPCPDPAANPAKAYLYRVRAVFNGGARSEYSNFDLAATFTFTDDPLNVNGIKPLIKAQHFTELRDAINAVRVAADLLPFQWSGSPQQSVGPQLQGLIYASHYNDLRTGLSEALTRLALPGPQAAAANTRDIVTHAPIQELRTLIR